MHYLELTMIFAAILSFGLTLAAAPQPAKAGICNEVGLPKKCTTRRDIKKNAITSSRVKDETLTGADIKDDSIGASDLGANSVGTSEIAGNAVGASELAIDAKPAAADFAEGDQDLNLFTNVATVVRSVALTAPAPGVVIVNGTVQLAFGGAASVVCSLETGLVIDSDAAAQQSTAVAAFNSVALTRGFEVSAGTTTFNLVCQELIGVVGAQNSILTALYVPKRG